jgi:hypothetical protein
MPNTINWPPRDEFVQLIATRAAEHWDYTAKSALTGVLAELLEGDHRAATHLVEETSRKLLAAEHAEEDQ